LCLALVNYWKKIPGCFGAYGDGEDIMVEVLAQQRTVLQCMWGVGVCVDVCVDTLVIVGIVDCHQVWAGELFGPIEASTDGGGSDEVEQVNAPGQSLAHSSC
jgi:hypothetical protein